MTFSLVKAKYYHFKGTRLHSSKIRTIIVVYLWNRMFLSNYQWRNRRGGRGRCANAPRDFRPWSLLTYREKIGKKKREMGQKEGKLKKRRWKIWNWRRKSYKMRRALFFFFFSKWLKFVLSLPKWKFSTKKSISRREKNQEKWLCPLRKIFLLRPCQLPSPLMCLRKEMFLFVCLFVFFLIWLFLSYFHLYL